MPFLLNKIKTTIHSTPTLIIGIRYAGTLPTSTERFYAALRDRQLFYMLPKSGVTKLAIEMYSLYNAL